MKDPTAFQRLKRVPEKAAEKTLRETKMRKKNRKNVG
jgi:hypothetical protein